MILNTINSAHYQYNHTTLFDVTTPQSTFLSYSIIPLPPRRFFRVSQCLCISVIQFLRHNQQLSSVILKSLRISLHHDTPSGWGLSNSPSFMPSTVVPSSPVQSHTLRGMSRRPDHCPVDHERQLLRVFEYLGNCRLLQNTPAPWP
jgi:hypothetical protein